MEGTTIITQVGGRSMIAHGLRLHESVTEQLRVPVNLIKMETHFLCLANLKFRIDKYSSSIFFSYAQVKWNMFDSGIVNVIFTSICCFSFI
jgi:hypothetical protein